MSEVVVVGAGVAGLAAARQLRARGLDVQLIERAPRTGGVIRTSEAGGFLREHAANGFLGRGQGGAARLAEELGVELVEASAEAKRRWIFVGDRLRALPASPVELVTSDLLSWRGKLMALGEPFRGRGRADLDETVGSFARRRFGREVADNIIAPFVTGIFAGDADQLSLEAAFPTLAELDRQGGMVRGMIKRRLAARGEEQAAGGGRLAAPRGGVEALVRALEAELGDAVRTGAPVVSVEAGGERPRVVLEGGEAIEAERVVLATPAHVSAGLLSGASPALAELLETIPYAPAVVVHLGYDRGRVEHPLDGFGFLVAEDERLRILGCVFESVLWPGRAPEGKVLLRCIFGGTRDPGAADASDEELVAAARRDLGDVLGARDEPAHVSVVRWPRAIAQYTVGHRRRVDRAEALARPLGVVLAGSGYHGVAVNSCVADAARVAREVLSGLGKAAAVFALVLFGLAACSGSKGSTTSASPGRDGGDAAVAGGQEDAPQTPAGAAPPYLVAPLDADGRVTDAGELQVTVAWDEPPGELVESPGFNPCGVRRDAPVSVHTLHGLRDAVVWIDGIGRGVAPPDEAPAELEVRGCQLRPRVQVASRLGAPLAVMNADERRHVARVGGDAVLPMPLVGQRYELPLEEPGIVRVDVDGIDDAGWVVVPGHPYHAKTGDKGVVRFDQVPAGNYEVVAWHPPVAEGGAPLRARADVVIEAGKTAEIVLQPRP